MSQERNTRERGRSIHRELRTAQLRAACVVALLAVTASAAAGCFPFSNALPVAEIDADPTQGLAPLTVEFDASESFDPDGSIRSYEWSFGDGQKGSGRRVEHTYTTVSAYEVTLTVTDKRGGRATASVTITVRGSNELPVAALAADPSPAYPGQFVQFTANASCDSDGQIVSYEWSFGDGATGSGVNTSHTYSAVGTYTVTLTVRDNDGGEQSATIAVQISTTINVSGTVSRHYEWDYNGRRESCNLDISVDLYRYYKSKVRGPFLRRDYDEYVLDPLDDAYLGAVTAEIVRNSTEYHEQLENALFFVQNCIVYVYDPRWYEYPRYPVEMLVDLIGDCEDTAILYTSLVRTLGHGALMVAVDADHNGSTDHMAAWVPVQPSFVAAHPDRSFWQYGGKTYAFAETAVEGGYVPLGVDPWGLTPDDIDTVYDVSSVDHAPKAVRVTCP